MSKSEHRLPQYLAGCRVEIEQRLDTLTVAPDKGLEGLYRAMRYSLLAGGKRIRAILMMAVADTLLSSHAHVLDAACALEMIHAYSLIHDDLPCMDDDDMRRGKPSNHRVFGEAMAVLAGDGLLTLAFSTLASISINPPVTADRVLACIREIGRSAGASGMVGGQALDMESTGKSRATVESLQSIHLLKTGALFRAAVRSAAILSGASDSLVSHLSRYADALGLAFQISDDILDIVGNQTIMGKQTGSDVKKGKATYPSVVGLEESRRLMSETLSEGKNALAKAGFSGTVLDEILDYVASRDH